MKMLKHKHRTEGRRTHKMRNLDRVMGYHRPISSFNIGKQGEFAERKYFDEKKCGCSK